MKHYFFLLSVGFAILTLLSLLSVKSAFQDPVTIPNNISNLDSSIDNPSNKTSTDIVSNTNSQIFDDDYSISDTTSIFNNAVFTPITTTESDDVIAALKAFNSYLSEHTLQSLVDVQLSPLYSMDNQIFMFARTSEGGIPPLELAGLRYDTSNLTVSELWYAWRLRSSLNETTTISSNQYQLTLPKSFSDYVYTDFIEGTIFYGSINQLPQAGMFFHLTEKNLQSVISFQNSTELYQDWPTKPIGDETELIGRNENNSFFFARASGVEYQNEERPFYELCCAYSEYWADNFLLQNKIQANPYWFFQSAGYTTSYNALRALLHSIIVEEQYIYFTIPKCYFKNSTGLIDQQSICISVYQTEEDTLSPPLDGWQPEQSYCLDTSNLDSIRIKINIQDQVQQELTITKTDNDLSILSH